MLLHIDLWKIWDFSQESLKGEGIIHTWKTVWLYFSNKQNDLLAEVQIMQYSKSWGWILFPVKWSMKRGNLCLHSMQRECTCVQTIAQLPANQSQSALQTGRAEQLSKRGAPQQEQSGFTHPSSSFTTCKPPRKTEDSKSETSFRDMCLLTYLPWRAGERLLQATKRKICLAPLNKIFRMTLSRRNAFLL